jgi:hypothetical protein
MGAVDDAHPALADQFLDPVAEELGAHLDGSNADGSQPPHDQEYAPAPAGPRPRLRES